jgi:hypothetical protein
MIFSPINKELRKKRMISGSGKRKSYDELRQKLSLKEIN